MITRYAKQIVIVSLAYCLVACSGGSGGSGSSAALSNTSSSAQAPATSNPDNSGSGSTGSTTPDSTAGAAITISWTPPTTREDGSALLLGDIHGYELYYYMDGSPEDEGTVITIDDPSTSQYTTSKLSPGTYYFAISSIDNNGIFSDLSDYVGVAIP